ncbi:MAG: hypothetical protein P857_576, partial [Candidatus Xenolissoclinum pacificiensis L6]
MVEDENIQEDFYVDEVACVNLLSKIEYMSIRHKEYIEFFRRNSTINDYARILKLIDGATAKKLREQGSIKQDNYQDILQLLEDLTPDTGELVIGLNKQAYSEIQKFITSIRRQMNSLDTRVKNYYFSNRNNATDDIHQDTELLYIYSKFNQVLSGYFETGDISKEVYHRYRIMNNDPLSKEEIQERNNIILQVPNLDRTQVFLLPVNDHMFRENTTSNIEFMMESYDMVYRLYSANQTKHSIIRFALALSMISLLVVSLVTGLPLQLAFALVSVATSIHMCIEMYDIIKLGRAQSKYAERIKNRYGILHRDNAMKSEFDKVHSSLALDIQEQSIKLECALRCVSLIGAIVTVLMVILGIEELIVLTAVVVPAVVFLIRAIGNAVIYHRLRTNNESQNKDADIDYTGSFITRIIQILSATLEEIGIALNMTITSQGMSIVMNSMTALEHVSDLSQSYDMRKNFEDKRRNDLHILMHSLSDTICENGTVIMEKGYVEEEYCTIFTVNIQKAITELRHMLILYSIKEIAENDLNEYIDEIINKLEQGSKIFSAEDKRVLRKVIVHYLQDVMEVSIVQQQSQDIAIDSRLEQSFIPETDLEMTEYSFLMKDWEDLQEMIYNLQDMYNVHTNVSSVSGKRQIVTTEISAQLQDEEAQTRVTQSGDVINDTLVKDLFTEIFGLLEKYKKDQLTFEEQKKSLHIIKENLFYLGEYVWNDTKPHKDTIMENLQNMQQQHQSILLKVKSMLGKMQQMSKIERLIVRAKKDSHIPFQASQDSKSFVLFKSENSLQWVLTRKEPLKLNAIISELTEYGDALSIERKQVVLKQLQDILICIPVMLRDSQKGDINFSEMQIILEKLSYSLDKISLSPELSDLLGVVKQQNTNMVQYISQILSQQRQDEIFRELDIIRIAENQEDEAILCTRVSDLLLELSTYSHMNIPDERLEKSKILEGISSKLEEIEGSSEMHEIIQQSKNRLDEITTTLFKRYNSGVLQEIMLIMFQSEQSGTVMPLKRLSRLLCEMSNSLDSFMSTEDLQLTQKKEVLQELAKHLRQVRKSCAPSNTALLCQLEMQNRNLLQKVFTLLYQQEKGSILDNLETLEGVLYKLRQKEDKQPLINEVLVLLDQLSVLLDQNNRYGQNIFVDSKVSSLLRLLMSLDMSSQPDTVQELYGSVLIHAESILYTPQYTSLIWEIEDCMIRFESQDISTSVKTTSRVLSNLSTLLQDRKALSVQKIINVSQELFSYLEELRVSPENKLSDLDEVQIKELSDKLAEIFQMSYTQQQEEIFEELEGIQISKLVSNAEVDIVKERISNLFDRFSNIPIQYRDMSLEKLNAREVLCGKILEQLKEVKQSSEIKDVGEILESHKSKLSSMISYHRLKEFYVDMEKRLGIIQEVLGGSISEMLPINLNEVRNILNDMSDNLDEANYELKDIKNSLGEYIENDNYHMEFFDVMHSVLKRMQMEALDKVSLIFDQLREEKSTIDAFEEILDNRDQRKNDMDLLDKEVKFSNLEAGNGHTELVNPMNKEYDDISGKTDKMLFTEIRRITEQKLKIIYDQLQEPHNISKEQCVTIQNIIQHIKNTVFDKMSNQSDFLKGEILLTGMGTDWLENTLAQVHKYTHQITEIYWQRGQEEVTEVMNKLQIDMMNNLGQKMSFLESQLNGNVSLKELRIIEVTLQNISPQLQKINRSKELSKLVQQNTSLTNRVSKMLQEQTVKGQIFFVQEALNALIQLENRSNSQTQKESLVGAHEILEFLLEQLKTFDNQDLNKVFVQLSPILKEIQELSLQSSIKDVEAVEIFKELSHIFSLQQSIVLDKFKEVMDCMTRKDMFFQEFTLRTSKLLGVFSRELEFLLKASKEVKSQLVALESEEKLFDQRVRLLSDMQLKLFDIQILVPEKDSVSNVSGALLEVFQKIQLWGEKHVEYFQDQIKVVDHLDIKEKHQGNTPSKDLQDDAILSKKKNT